MLGYGGRVTSTVWVLSCWRSIIGERKKRQENLVKQKEEKKKGRLAG